MIGSRGTPLQGSPGTGGYLRVTFYADDGIKCTGSVHVLVCEAFHGPRPDGMVARHRNGNKLDNRPENVVWGTPAENYEDRDAHGATARGERQHLAKLTDEKVVEIRRLLVAEEQSLEKIGERFGVTGAAISAIAHRKTWTHVPDEFPEWTYRAEHGTNRRGEGNGNSRLSEGQVIEIKRLLAEGKMSQQKIADRFGVSKPLIYRINRGLVWAHIQATSK